MTLFDRVFGGNDYNYARTVAAIDEAIATYGEGEAVAFPNTSENPLIIHKVLSAEFSLPWKKQSAENCQAPHSGYWCSRPLLRIAYVFCCFLQKKG